MGSDPSEQKKKVNNVKMKQAKEPGVTGQKEEMPEDPKQAISRQPVQKKTWKSDPKKTEAETRAMTRIPQKQPFQTVNGGGEKEKKGENQTRKRAPKGESK